MAHPPAYQYYPAAFEQGTATMTLSEVGAYQRLLNYQWTHGSVPGDDLRLLSRIMRCTLSAAKPVWATVSEKFEKQSESVWKNARMELVRQEQADFREGKSRSGKAGAAARWQKDGGANGKRMAEPMAKPMANACQEVWQTDGSLSLSSSLTTPTASRRPPTLIKPRNLHAVFEHPRFDVPQVWHDKRVNGLADHDHGMSLFYKHLAAHVDRHPEEDTEPRMDWLTKHFNAWVAARQPAVSSASDVPDVEETRRRMAKYTR